MAGASESYHEPLEQLSAETRNMHRALVSLQEELEAVDWYRQRADASDDPELRDVLLHNMREEVEHACMVLEWLRRNSEDFDRQLRIYLFTEHAIVDAEEAAEQPETARHGQREDNRVSPGAGQPPPAFTIGSLKGR